MSISAPRSGISSETIEREKLERYYTYAGKDTCVACGLYAEVFVYRATNTPIFDIGEKNIYWDLKNKEFSVRLLDAFESNGYHLNMFLNKKNGGRAKARIEELDYNTFTIKNPFATPSGAIKYESFLLKSNFKIIKVYRREEKLLCADCILTTIQTHLKHSADSKAATKEAKPVEG